jgi:sugar/nucleoside kinase (ribokinase family)
VLILKINYLPLFFNQWISQVATKFRANGIGAVCGRFFIGTAEKIPDSELIDTTGAGDAFIGAIMYGRCSH